MKRIKNSLWLLLLLVFLQPALPQKSYVLPDAVITELNRLDESYLILDQFSTRVWENWNDYLDFPFLFTFPNGLRVLVGHPSPPEVFVPYPGITVHGLKVSIDTSRLISIELKQPFTCGGGLIPFGSSDNKFVTIVNIRFSMPPSSAGAMSVPAERTILVFIHELMHCYQKKILTTSYGNLNINTDLNIALYSDVEGKALLKAYEQTSYEAAVPYMKDFCIARRIRFRDLSPDEKNSSRADEFREGEAVYSEVIILQNLGAGFTSSPAMKNDSGYSGFNNTRSFLASYANQLKYACEKTLDIHGKNYPFGCFEALLLQSHFPGWQNEIRNGKWLDQILAAGLDISPADSIASMKRFEEIYQLSELSTKHSKIIADRDNAYLTLSARKGMTYIIDTKQIAQFLGTYVDRSLPNYALGLLRMFPEGLGQMSFDGIKITFKPVPSEINELYYVKIIDTEPLQDKKPFEIEYESAGENGMYINAVITTPMFVLRAPKIEIVESSNRVKFIIHSRI